VTHANESEGFLDRHLGKAALAVGVSLIAAGAAMPGGSLVSTFTQSVGGATCAAVFTEGLVRGAAWLACDVVPKLGLSHPR
jgi:hypothetical protein